MVRAKLILDRLAVVPDRPYLGAAVVVLVPDPAAAAVVVLVTNNEAVVVSVLIVIARHDLAARRLFGREMIFCANHRSLPSRWQESFIDRKSTRLNSSHANISYAVFCLKKKKDCTCGSL